MCENLSIIAPVASMIAPVASIIALVAQNPFYLRAEKTARACRLADGLSCVR